MKKVEKGMSGWQLIMMALGSVIGGTFFLGIAVAINAAGPSIIIAYIIGGILAYLILYALSEMTVANPYSGSFYTYTSETFGPGAGFVVGWVYWTGKIFTMTSEATAAAILLKQWFPRLSVPIIGCVIIVLVTLINLLGASKLSKLESSLSIIKVFAIIAFIVLALLLILGAIKYAGGSPIGIGALANEPFMPGGIRSLLGSMLIVVLAYSGFEVIGLAASETENPGKTIPRVITRTVIILVSLFILSNAALLPLIQTEQLTDKVSPMVAALSHWGMGWASLFINFILVTAILSTMLASMFGIGRMLRSLAEDGNAPKFLRDTRDVPYKDMLFSGFCMLISMGFGVLSPSLYLFLISSGGFATLITYAAIMATHIRFRKCNGCPPEGKCQMPGYPYTSWVGLVSIAIIIISMPFIAGQTSGLIVGIIMVVFFTGAYFIMKKIIHSRLNFNARNFDKTSYGMSFSHEFSEELTQGADIGKKDTDKSSADIMNRECDKKKE